MPIFESHVTVDCSEDEFKKICERLGVRPLIIEMDTGSDYKTQMMTRKFHKGSEQDAKREMDFIASQFSSVVRRKLEMIIGKETTIPDHLYQEFHAKFEVPLDKVYHFLLQVSELGGHSSRNSLKLDAGSGLVYHFATARDLDHMRRIVFELKHQYNLVSTIRECVVFDDNQGMDSNWSCSECLIKNVNIEG